MASSSPARLLAACLALIAPPLRAQETHGPGSVPVTAPLPPTENSPPRGGRIPDSLPHGEGVGSVGGGPEQLRVPYESGRRTFGCEVPPWPGFEEETAYGSAAHFLGPPEAEGAWRAALHVHFMEKGRPGFVPLETMLRRERAGERRLRRSATALQRWRVARAPARRFEVTEARQLPFGRLPSREVVLHHYYAFVPAGDGYFIVKLSTTRESYLEYRDEFERILDTFRILGYD